MATMAEDTMRERFSTVAADLVDQDPRVAIVLADIGVDRFAKAAKAYPGRVINVGIREQALIGVTAGLALEGLRPIAHTYAPFLVERPFEQLKLDLSHQDIGAILVSVGASYDWAAGGRTHHAPGDVALLSTLPDWEIHVPGHPGEVETLLRRAVRGSERCYIRLSERSNAASVDVSANRFAILRQDARAKATVVAVGPTLDATRHAIEGRNVNLLYAATVRPFDGATLHAVANAPNVVIVEPYLEGSSTTEIVRALGDRPHRILPLGVPQRAPRRYGTADEHERTHGLDPQGIRWAVDEFLGDVPTPRPE